MTVAAIALTVVVGVIVVLASVVGAVLAVRQFHAYRQPDYLPPRPIGRAARWQRSRDDPDSVEERRPLPTDHDLPDTLGRLAAEWTDRADRDRWRHRRR